jgi:hypothetical protein
MEIEFRRKNVQQDVILLYRIACVRCVGGQGEIAKGATHMHQIYGVRRWAPTEFIRDRVAQRRKSPGARDYSQLRPYAVVSGKFTANLLRRESCHDFYCGKFLLRGIIIAIFATSTHLPFADSRPGAPGTSIDKASTVLTCENGGRV